METNDFIHPDAQRIVAEQTNVMLQMRMAEYSKEFQRYKQDCRKRALDLAHCEYPDRKQDKPDLLKNADEYYDWLITIPEK